MPYKKVKAKDITLDNMRWQWNVRRGAGLVICDRQDLPDGRIKFLLGEEDCDMIVQPNDYIWAQRTVYGYWNDQGQWVLCA